MPRYKIVAKVDRVVSKEVHITVEAPSLEAAEDMSRTALNTYPDKITGDDAPERMVTMKEHTWIPKNIDFVRYEELPAKE